MRFDLTAQPTADVVAETIELLSGVKVAAVFGDRLTLCSFALAINTPTLVGAATTEDEGFDLVLEQSPDLLICSSDLEVGYGPSLLRRVHDSAPNCKRVIVVDREQQIAVKEAMDSFAQAVIFKSSLGTGNGDLIKAFRAVLDDEVYYPIDVRKSAVSLLDSSLPPLIEPLTERELEVVAGVSRGLKNNAIAAEMFLGVETIKTHVTNAMAKLGARDRTQMAVKALLYGLIDPVD